MSTWWIIAFLALSSLVVVLAILVAGFGQRVLTLLESERGDATIHHGANPTHMGIPIGSRPPLSSFQLASADPPKLPAIVTFLEASCRECRILREDLSKHALTPTDVNLVAVVDEARPFKVLEARGWRVIEDPAKSIFRAWLVTGTPLAYLVGSDGVVVGADIPNDADHVANLASLNEPIR